MRRIDKGERGIWQRRYWEHTIRDERDFADACRLHYPVKHGYVDRVRDWPYSSFHRYVRLGICPLDWAGGETISELEYGDGDDGFRCASPILRLLLSLLIRELLELNGRASREPVRFELLTRRTEIASHCNT